MGFLSGILKVGFVGKYGLSTCFCENEMAFGGKWKLLTKWDLKYWAGKKVAKLNDIDSAGNKPQNRPTSSVKHLTDFCWSSIGHHLRVCSALLCGKSKY